MNDQLNWDNQNSHSLAAPADANATNATNGGSQQQDVSKAEVPAQNNMAGDRVAMATPSDAAADQKHTNSFPEPEQPWPALGDALLTTDEARLHLYKQHDIFIKERYIQKLVSDFKKLDGRRVPKDGGGVELQITQSSLDQYATDNPQKKNAADIPLDPNDKLFERLREVAQGKPFTYSIEGVAPQKTETPTLAPTTMPKPEPPASEQKPVVEPTATATPTPAPESVPLALYESTLKRMETMEEMNLKLYDTLDSAYDKIANMNTELLAMTKHVTEKLESPATILNSMTSTLKAANNVDDHRPAPTSTHHPEAQAPATRYNPDEADHHEQYN